jgi:MYXO-CTERM domain-containing protein
MKRLFAVLCVALTATSLQASALLFNPPPGGHHHGMNAREVAGLGVGAAALLGVGLYLVLRRRDSSQD